MLSEKKIVSFLDAKKIDYSDAWKLQEDYLQKLIKKRTLNPKHKENKLLFCEHNPVFTLGTNGKKENLLVSESFLKQNGVDFFKVNRGGDITFHGHGQITGYLIFDLYQFGTDIHLFIRNIERSIVLFLSKYGIDSRTIEGKTGVWVGNEEGNERKICAIGIRASRWATMHGFVMNISNDMRYYDMIIPCGIKDKQVTSLEKEIEKEVDFLLAKTRLIESLETIFNFTLDKYTKQ